MSQAVLLMPCSEERSEREHVLLGRVVDALLRAAYYICIFLYIVQNYAASVFVKRPASSTLRAASEEAEESARVSAQRSTALAAPLRSPLHCARLSSSIDMYNNDVGKKSAIHL